MKLQELPSPYRELAEMRREQQKDTHYGTTWKNRFNETNNLFYAFGWGETPDGFEFWARAYSGNTPEIPASSLQELAEWQKSKGEQPTLIGGKTDTEWLYLFAGQAMQGGLANPEMTCENIALEAVLQAKALLTQLKKEVENV